MNPSPQKPVGSISVKEEYMVILLRPPFMADALDVVTRSFNINNKLGPKLEVAAEQNAILRIGWTNAGDPAKKW